MLPENQSTSFEHDTCRECRNWVASACVLLECSRVRGLWLNARFCVPPPLCSSSPPTAPVRAVPCRRIDHLSLQYVSTRCRSTTPRCTEVPLERDGRLHITVRFVRGATEKTLLAGRSSGQAERPRAARLLAAGAAAPLAPCSAGSAAPRPQRCRVSQHKFLSAPSSVRSAVALPAVQRCAPVARRVRPPLPLPGALHI